MKVVSDILDCIHLDPGFAVLSVQNLVTCMEYFKMLDVHLNGTINDYLFWTFMRSVTTLTKPECDKVFQLLDLDLSGEIEFEEFYFLFCVLIACKDHLEKEFIHRHADNIFKMFDYDGSGLITKAEFTQLGVLFNFESSTIANIFREFELGNRDLDLGEFRLFAMACIDEQRERAAHIKVDAIQRNEAEAVKTLRPILLEALKTNNLPNPQKVVKALRHFERPRLRVQMPWYERIRPARFLYTHPKLRRCVKHTGRRLKSVGRFFTNILIAVLYRIWMGWRWCTESRADRDRRLGKASEVSKRLKDYRQFNRNKRRGLIKPKKIPTSRQSGSTSAATTSTATSKKSSATATSAWNRPRWARKVGPAPSASKTMARSRVSK